MGLGEGGAGSILTPGPAAALPSNLVIHCLSLSSHFFFFFFLPQLVETSLLLHLSCPTEPAGSDSAWHGRCAVDTRQ